MSKRHHMFLRTAAAVAVACWMPYSASAQTLAAIAPMSIAPSLAPAPSTQMGAPSGSSGDAASFPDDPLKVAAEHVLETHCARCHQTDRLIGRSKAAKGFGNILDLDALATNPKFVKPGDADRSLLYHVIVRREMPSDVFQDGDLDHPVPDDKDMKALRSWITSLAPDQTADVKVASLPHADEQLPVTPAVRDRDALGQVEPDAKTATDAALPQPASLPAAPEPQIVVASKETGTAMDGATMELVTSAQQNLKRLGCYAGDLNGVVDASTNAAIGHYNGIMGRGEKTSAVTSDMIEEMRSESGNICATRPILPAPAASSDDDDDQGPKVSHSHAASADKHEPKPAHRPVPPPKTRVAHEPAERKAAPPKRTARDLHMREPSYRQAQRQPSYRQAERSSGGGGGGGGGGASTVSGINGI